MLPNVNELREAHQTLVASIDRLTDATLRAYPVSDQTKSLAEREWQPFVIYDGGTTDGSGNLTLTLNHPPAGNGWEAYIGRIAVTVQGASAAATVANYHGGVQDTSLFDYANAMFGNTPSRIVADYNTPVYFRDGQQLIVVITGAVASQGVGVRVEGRRRQVGGSVPS